LLFGSFTSVVMILVYRPELESPPMDKECTIGFSFIEEKGQPSNIKVTSGVNRDFPEAIWEKIKNYDYVKSLLKLGALRIADEETAVVAEASPAETDSLADMPVTQAMSLVEDSFDVTQLRRREGGEQRIRVLNAINKRVAAISEGKG
jgi:hypothetical protein